MTNYVIPRERFINIFSKKCVACAVHERRYVTQTCSMGHVAMTTTYLHISSNCGNGCNFKQILAITLKHWNEWWTPYMKNMLLQCLVGTCDWELLQCLWFGTSLLAIDDPSEKQPCFRIWWGQEDRSSLAANWDYKFVVCSIWNCDQSLVYNNLLSWYLSFKGRNLEDCEMAQITCNEDRKSVWLSNTILPLNPSNFLAPLSRH